MDKYIYDKNNGLWYELQGEYYLPCLTLPPEEEKPIGIWGQRHKRYLKEHRHNAADQRQAQHLSYRDRRAGARTL